MTAERTCLLTDVAAQGTQFLIRATSTRRPPGLALLADGSYWSGSGACRYCLTAMAWSACLGRVARPGAVGGLDHGGGHPPDRMDSTNSGSS
nr:transposase [Streptomyces sp. FXJ1.172]